MSQTKILAQLQLMKNHKGTFYVDIEVDGQKLFAYLSNKVIEGGKLYTSPLEGSYYWASINLSNGSAFINQLLPLSQYSEETSGLEYHCYCQRLEDGRIHLITEQSNNHIVLPKQTLSDFAYRIFHNSKVMVTFGHNNSGFFIKEWQTEYPNDIDKGIAINIRKKTDYYLADYYIAKDIYLPVKIESYLLKYEGIYDINEKACINATLTLDDQQKKANISLTLDHQALVNKYNQPKAKLTFIGIKEREGSDLYQFETMLIDGISLLIAIFSYELKFMAEDIVSFQNGQSVSAFLTYKISGKWCNFKIPVAAKNEYNEQFRCITMTSIDNEGMTLLETVEPPHDRLLLPKSELIKQGIYKIHSGVIFGLHITREALDKPWKEKLWHIESINSNFFVGVNNDVGYKSECTVIESWSRYENRPEYVVDLDRYHKNKYKDDIYAFHNHCAAKMTNKYADLLVIIPKSLLVQSGFKTLKPDIKLTIVFSLIKFPMFGIKAATFLCADRLYTSAESMHDGVDESRYVLAEFYEKLGSSGSKEKYRFSIIGSEDTVDFTDWNSQLSGIADLDKYRYKMRIKQNKQYLNVKEMISASIK
ncbi:hypothetical protein ACI2I3_01750 [Psychrobacter namhaensis]|uniref:Uncharacterized protein n=1 Tax=Psychrobacter namhaensis TaxID=292734 RepID=A0ABW8L579_9GAMM